MSESIAANIAASIYLSGLVQFAKHLIFSSVIQRFMVGKGGEHLKLYHERYGEVVIHSDLWRENFSVDCTVESIDESGCSSNHHKLLLN